MPSLDPSPRFSRAAIRSSLPVISSFVFIATSLLHHLNHCSYGSAHPNIVWQKQRTCRFRQRPSEQLDLGERKTDKGLRNFLSCFYGTRLRPMDLRLSLFLTVQHLLSIKVDNLTVCFRLMIRILFHKSKISLLETGRRDIIKSVPKGL
jgi:hypothetical protein